mgnify:CR=1 FL=1
MKGWIRWLPVLLLAWAGCGTEDGGSGGRRGFRVGYAEADITPPVGTLMGAYGLPGIHRAMTGVHDPLMAQAALFANDAGEAFLIVTLDVAGYLWDFGDWGPGIKALRQSIARALEPGVLLAPEHVMVTSSHSHAATDLTGFYQDIGQGPDPALLQEMQRTLTALAVAAAADLRDANLRFGTTGLSGYTARDQDCSPVLDESVAILQAVDADGKVIVTLANYAKHPTIAPESNRLASADFVWGYRDEMQKATGAPAMFLQGFEAAVHGKYSFHDGEDVWDRVHEVGAALARAVIDAMPAMVPADSYRIEHRAATYSCTGDDSFLVDSILYLDMPKRYLTLNDDGSVTLQEIEVSWHRLGPAEFVAFPGEPSPEYGLMAKARMASPFRFAVALANDQTGYIVEPGSVANDPSGRLAGYELRMGIGAQAGPAAWAALEGLGWFAPGDAGP